MRIAWLSPLPPMPSGIADYSYELLPLVADRSTVEAVCPRPGLWKRARSPGGIAVRDPQALAGREDEFDAVFHHLGNNPYHEFVYEHALAMPGVAVFHELVLHHLIAHLLVEGRHLPDRYRALMRAEYGQAGGRLADLRSRAVATDFEKFLFPLAGPVARSARAIVVHNQDARDRMAELAPGVPVTVIPHHAGSPPPQVAGVTRDVARRELGIPEEAFVVGHFGYITKPKHPGAVIGGFAKLLSRRPDALLLMAGADHSGGGLERLVERHGLAGRVRLAGFVDLARFYVLMRAVEAVVNLRYPSAGESSGTLARALAEGRAVIVNDVGSFAELPEDVALKVELDEDQAEAVGAHLIRLAEDSELRVTMERRAREYAGTVLDPERCAGLYVQVASEVGRGGQQAGRKPLRPPLVAMPISGASEPATSSGPEGRDPALAVPEHRRLAADIERLAAESLPPSGAGAYLDLVYRLLLRRPVEEHALREALLSLAAGKTTRAELARWAVESREFRETELIEKSLATLKLHPGPFTGGEEADLPPDTTERLVEIPWVLSRWKGERRVLDLGYAYASGAYLSALLALPIERLHGVDWSAAPVPGMVRTRADLRSLPYRDAAFDLVICVSTIEHVGMDNARYGLTGYQTEGGDTGTLLEVQRVLAPGGRLLITVPFGRREDHDWFIQYDSARWGMLVAQAGSLRVTEQQIFHITDVGWERAEDIRALEHLSYGVDAPAARAVLCAELVKSA